MRLPEMVCVRACMRACMLTRGRSNDYSSPDSLPVVLLSGALGVSSVLGSLKNGVVCIDQRCVLPQLCLNTCQRSSDMQ